MEAQVPGPLPPHGVHRAIGVRGGGGEAAQGVLGTDVAEGVPQTVVFSFQGHQLGILLGPQARKVQ